MTDDIEEAIRACRREGDAASAATLMLQHWRALDAEARAVAVRDAEERWRSDPLHSMSATNTLSFMEVIRGGFERALAAIADWPEVGLALLDEPELARWQPTLIGQLARDESLRLPMVDRALAHHRGNFALMRSFIETGAAQGDRRLLDTTATMLLESPQPSTDAAADLAKAYADLGDLVTASRIALAPLLLNGSTGPLLGLLSHTHCPVPEAAFDAVVRLSDDEKRARTVADLRQLGYAEAAARLATMLLESGRGTRSMFTPAMLMAGEDPAGALDIVEGLVHATATPPNSTLGVGFQLALARFLESVAITEATAPRVLALAEFVAPRPVREAILDRVKSREGS